MKTLLLILAAGAMLSAVPTSAEAQVLRRRDPFQVAGQPEYQPGFNQGWNRGSVYPYSLPQRGHFNQDYQWNIWPQQQWYPQEQPYYYEDTYPYGYDYGYSEDYAPNYWEDYGWQSGLVPNNSLPEDNAYYGGGESYNYDYGE